jgi:hypothetical protein
VTGRHAEGRSAIEAALLDFQRSPGKHMLGLRQPALLFASIREVLQYAGERTPDDDASPPPAAVVQAARFFVRSALLKPDADHYALLGLTRDAGAAAIKERYRSLMRLTHPDFATGRGSASWPADAATRINQAYEVLSSPERRRAYDEAGEPPPSPPASREISPRPQNVAPAPRRGHSRQILRHLAAGFGVIAALAVVALWAATVSSDRDSLVQRATTRVVADKLPSLFGQAASPATAAPAEDDVLQAAVARALPAILASPVSAPPRTPAASSVALVASDEPAPAPVESPASRFEVKAEPVAAPASSMPAAVIQVATVAPAAADAPPAPAPVATPAPSKPVIVAQAPPAPSRPAPAGPSMADVHPLVTRLLGDIESGWGDNLIASLDFGTRRSADAQSLARQLDALCDGARPVKITKVDLKGEPRDGKLVVVGQVVLQVRDPSTPTRRFALQAEFTQQGGTPVLTRLAPVSAQ